MMARCGLLTVVRCTSMGIGSCPIIYTLGLAGAWVFTELVEFVWSCLNFRIKTFDIF